jgi:cytoskeletal protein RodZ
MPITMPTLAALPKRENTAVPRSQTERLWLIGGGLVAFIMLLIGYFFFVSPQRSDTADVDGQVATTQQENAQLRARLDTLAAQNKNLAKFEADLTKARLALPSSSGVSDFLRSLQALGAATHTDVTSLTVGQPVAVKQVVTTAPGAAVQPTSTPSAAAGGTTTGGAQTSAAPAATVYSLNITAGVTGTPGALDSFLDQLQAVQPRAVLITQIAETTGATTTGAKTSAGGTTLQLTMQAFVAPERPAAVAATPTQGTK